MATGGEEKVDYSLANVGTLTLENIDKDPFYISIVVCQDKIIVIDYNEWEARIHRLRDGKFLAKTQRLESKPRGMCLMDSMTICLLHGDGLIILLSIDSTDMSSVSTTTRNLSLYGVLDEYYGVVRFKDNLVVSGVKQGTMYWCIVSLDDGHADTVHQICEGDGLSYVTTKDNIVYIACYAGRKSPGTGVYGFDIMNPSQCKYTYKHQLLEDPTSIVINEDGNIYVCSYRYHDSCIHQLTALCQLVSIFNVGIPPCLRAIFWDNGRLYATRVGSSDITVFQPKYQGKQPVIDGRSTQIEPDIPIQQSVEENLNQAGIQMSTEERDLFLRFQYGIGTAIYFSKGPHRLTDDQETLKATETFFEQSRPDMRDKWLEYKSQGKLTPELIDVIYAKERNPELHDKKDEILVMMEHLNIIVKARSFDENGVKEENYFFTPCMLRVESPREVIAPEDDPRMLSTSVLCWVFKGKFLPPAIFDGLLAACLARWPVTKKKDTSKYIISYACTVFDLDLTHRLTLNCENHVVFARITWLVIDDIKTPDAKLCTRVRKFITRNLSKITSSLNQNLQYELYLQSQESQDISEDSWIRFAPFEMWFEDEGHDPDSPIKPEHMNHARLCVALVTVCGKALKEILLENFPASYKDIYQAILANQAKLTGGRGRPLLNQEQIKLVFPDPLGQETGTVETFDLSLLYTLIRNVSTVQAPVTGWAIDPQPGDNSLGASVERIRSYRNHISGHSPDAKINHQDFEDYWRKFEDVLRDIEIFMNGKVYSTELERQKRQVISVFDAC